MIYATLVIIPQRVKEIGIIVLNNIFILISYLSNKIKQG